MYSQLYYTLLLFNFFFRCPNLYWFLCIVCYKAVAFSANKDFDLRHESAVATGVVFLLSSVQLIKFRFPLSKVLLACCDHCLHRLLVNLLIILMLLFIHSQKKILDKSHSLLHLLKIIEP